jgi:hypothetical protein
VERQVAALTLAAAHAHLHRDDAPLAMRLLPALHIEIGAEWFESDFLSETQDANLRFIVGTRSSKSVGKFLRRIAGLEFNGHVLDADTGKRRNRRQWRVRQIVSSAHTVRAMRGRP